MDARPATAVCLLDEARLRVTVRRLALQILENHGDFSGSCLIGLQPRGVPFAERLRDAITTLAGRPLLFGRLDITFYRDDFRHRAEPLRASQTDIAFLTEGKRVVLADDVLFTGRSVRAAMDALAAHGRPASVELCALADRRLTRELPIEATYTGLTVDTRLNQRIYVTWGEHEGVYLS